jgi:preprotein translocase SecE subunit
MKRVSWPTREQLVAFTAVTLITSTVLTLFIFGLDIFFKDGLLFFLGGS